MARPYSYLILATILLPGILTSEPPVSLGKTNNVPVEIVFSWITPFDPNPSLLLRIQWNSLQEISSPCKSESSIINKTESAIMIQWRPTWVCPLPFITFDKKNYVLPVNGFFPEDSTLSDVSTQTLRNTLESGAFLRTDTRLSSFSVRTFFENIEYILRTRETKFSLPIPNSPIPTKATHLPNSARPFRAGVTDGVHHGFDFYVNKWTPVEAIEDAVVIHVKRDFSWDEMNHLNEWHSDLEKQENLDVYRGNTVYLKTVSGHVAIYAHLSNIPENIVVWQTVSRGEVVWHVWDSAVPDKKYLYHLHFEIAMNPLQDEKAGQYTFSDILLWPFWGKGKTAEWIRANSTGLFN